MLDNMSNNKQTSVDWQFDQLSSENLLGLFTHDQMKRAMEILEQAKAMHKEEIEDAHWHGGQDIPIHESTCEQYYNETFRGNN
jgi:hypothetical protein